MDSSEKKLCWQYMLTLILFNNIFFWGGGQNFRICLLRIVNLTLFTIIWIANVKFAIEPFIMLYKFNRDVCTSIYLHIPSIISPISNGDL